MEEWEGGGRRGGRREEGREEGREGTIRENRVRLGICRTCCSRVIK